MACCGAHGWSAVGSDDFLIRGESTTGNASEGTVFSVESDVSVLSIAEDTNV